VIEPCFNTFNRSAFLGVEPDLPGQIRAAAKAGYKLFGPDVFSLDRYAQEGGRIEDLASMITDSGMQCYEIAALNVGAAEHTLPAARHMAELAGVLEPTWILSNVGAPVDEVLGRTFAQVCDILAAEGCRPAVEYLPFTPGYNIATAAQLVDYVGRDRAKILFDTWHHFRGPDGWAELEEAPADLVAYVQFDDALPAIGDDAVDETLNRRTFPGHGEFDLARYCAIMRAKGFDGVVSVEVLSSEWRANPDLDAFAKLTYETTMKAWESDNAK